MSLEMKKAAGKDKDAPLRRCPSCGCIHVMSKTCPNCAYEYPVVDRSVMMLSFVGVSAPQFVVASDITEPPGAVIFRNGASAMIV